MKQHITELKLVLGAMVILALATSLMVIVPWLLLDRVHPAGLALQPYTVEQLRGRQQYIANGCVYCHSQQPRDPAQAPDQARGWGRPSVAADYYYDNPHLLGTMRTGPDLFNIGARQPSRDWQLGHLYQPRAYTKDSIMPAYPYLFIERHGPALPGEVVVNLPPEFAPAGGAKVIATQAALDLVAYLLALDHTYPVLPAPNVSGNPANNAQEKK